MSGVPKNTLARCLVMTTSCGCGLNSGRMALSAEMLKAPYLQCVSPVVISSEETPVETLAPCFCDDFALEKKWTPVRVGHTDRGF